VTQEPVNHRIALGRSGEDRAAAWYTRHGYQIVERNWRSRTGEIDLVCALDNILVAGWPRSTSTGTPAGATNPDSTSSPSSAGRSPSSKVRFESFAA
jgi:hypothetical protein